MRLKYDASMKLLWHCGLSYPFYRDDLLLLSTRKGRRCEQKMQLVHDAVCQRWWFHHSRNNLAFQASAYHAPTL